MLRDFTWTEKYKEAMSDEHPPRASYKSVEIVAAAEGYLIITHVKKIKESKKQLFRICLPVIICLS